MPNVKSLTSKTPIPPVVPDDVKRVWALILETGGRQFDEPPDSTIGIDVRLIARQCSSGADVFAVFFRTILLQELLREGMLDDWREGNELRDTVFNAIATFPLQHGIESFDPNGFIEQLRFSGA